MARAHCNTKIHHERLNSRAGSRRNVSRRSLSSDGANGTSRRNVVTVMSLIHTHNDVEMRGRASRSLEVAGTFRALGGRMRETKIVGQIAFSLSPVG